MTADFFPPMVMDAQIVTVTRDEWSDYTEDTSTSIKCHFRQIDTTRRMTHSVENDADAMIWFAADANVEKDTIIRFDDVDYQVERIVKARRLGESTVQFLKCDLKITKVV